MGFDYNSLSQATNLFNNLQNSQRHEIITVNSLQQVKDFAINKGDSYLILDPNADTLYIKECDSIGKVNLRVFALTEITQEVINNTTPISISKTEYEKLLKRLESVEGKKNAINEPKQKELGLW